MSTVDYLFEKHKSPILNVEDKDICGPYFGLKPAVARRYAMEGKLKIKARPLRDGHGAPWFIRIEDLARYLDGIR